MNLVFILLIHTKLDGRHIKKEYDLKYGQLLDESNQVSGRIEETINIGFQTIK
jgi:hypothetical protein